MEQFKAQSVSGFCNNIQFLQLMARRLPQAHMWAADGWHRASARRPGSSAGEAPACPSTQTEVTAQEPVTWCPDGRPPTPDCQVGARE